MTQEQANKISASFFRMMFYMRMLKHEADYARGMKIPPHITELFVKVQNAVKWSEENARRRLPGSLITIDRIMGESEGKIPAMANIIERMVFLSEDDLNKFEDDFLAQVQINYSGDDVEVSKTKLLSE